MPFRIFVSYSSKDLPHVEALQRQLHGSAVEVFVAEHSVKPSEDLAPRIANAIEECDFFVLLWSENAKASDWVSQEIGRASALKKPILPLVLSPNSALPGFIQGLKYLPVHTNSESALEQARSLILEEYNRKEAQLAAAARKKRDDDAKALMAIGAFLLWVFK